MTRFFDGTKLIDIEMTGNSTTPIEMDFFEVGGLPFDEHYQAYRVDDVDYLIEQAEDWKGYVFDYADDEYEGERYLEVRHLVYAFYVGGEKDGELFGVFDNEAEAINASRDEIENTDADICIVGADGEDVIDW